METVRPSLAAGADATRNEVERAALDAIATNRWSWRVERCKPSQLREPGVGAMPAEGRNTWQFPHGFSLARTGRDPEARDEARRSVAEIARSNKHPRTLERLRAASA